MKNKKDKKIIICKECGKSFDASLRRSPIVIKYCSYRCLNARKKRRLIAKNKSIKVKKIYCDALWSKKVKQLAGSECEYCGRTGNLSSHHVITRSNTSLRWIFSNGVCLCIDHHTKNSFSAHKSPEAFLNFLKSKRGNSWYEDLLKLSRTVVKFSNNDRIAVKEGLKHGY